jgi:hypothetical protein
VRTDTKARERGCVEVLDGMIKERECRSQEELKRATRHNGS